MKKIPKKYFKIKTITVFESAENKQDNVEEKIIPSTSSSPPSHNANSSNCKNFNTDYLA
jgi:hypothetical protein